MNAVLIIKIIYLGVYVHHIQPIERHDYLNLTVCYELRERVRDRYTELGAEIVDLECLPQWEA